MFHDVESFEKFFRAVDNPLTRSLIIYILRHGEAEPKSSHVSDEERHLTTLGSSRLRKNLVIAKQVGTEIDLILTSPLVRAKESAEIAGDVFAIEKYEIEESLEPTRTPYEVFQSLARYAQVGRVLLVTHQPLASRSDGCTSQLG